ncbi:MAG: hypothetical protein ABIS14_04695 [Sphingomonas sp.]
MTFEIEVIVDIGMDAGEFFDANIRLNLTMARSRRRKGRSLLSTQLLAQRPISCFSPLPISFIAAP